VRLGNLKINCQSTSPWHDALRLLATMLLTPEIRAASAENATKPNRWFIKE